MNKALLFIAILTICIVSRSEADFFIPCIPELQKYFGLNAFQAQLASSLNFMGYCGGILLAGLLGDRFNRRIIILWSLFGFALGTLLCAIAPYYEILLLGRFAQGASIAGPTTLVYIVLVDRGQFKNQLKALGLINGIITLVMATVPTLGGYLGLYKSWRFNFFAVLGLALIALLISYKGIKGNRAVKGNYSISFKAYAPLLRSKKVLLYSAALCFIIAPYWVFISMSSLYYVNGLGVPLQEYMYYKNILAVIFGVVSMLNGLLVRILGGRVTFFLSMGLCLLSLTGQSVIVIQDINDPKIITAAMGVLAAGSAFLINFLYANALSITIYNISKLSALIHSIRLLFTSIALGLVSQFYNGDFVVIGAPLIIMLFAGLSLTLYLFVQGSLKGI